MEAGFKFPEEYSGNIKDQLFSRLAALQAGQEYTILRVDKINGSIKELYNRSEHNEKELIRHAGACVLRGRVEEIMNLLASTKSYPQKVSELNVEIAELNTQIVNLDKKVVEQIAEKKESARWQRMVMPIIVGVFAALLTAVGTLMMINSKSFVRLDQTNPVYQQNGAIK